jgi:hypothetical protein
MSLVIILAIAVATIGVLYMFMNSKPHVCDAIIYRERDGSVKLQPSGRWFPDMNAFKRWWSVEHKECKLPVLKGATKKHEVMENESDEQTYAKTPINKVDDYEFSRIFGYERNGRMEIPRQNFNIILNKRAFDWADRPLSSDERRAKYAGLTEGFTANGDLMSANIEDIAREAVARYGEHRKEREARDACNRESREDRKVAEMVANAYSSDSEYEPVITKVGPHHWEVNELKPVAPNMLVENPQDNRVVNTANDAVDIAFEYRQKEAIDFAIDPYFPENQRPFSEPTKPSGDPYKGYVPGLERMFGPTLDHAKWY